jgi:hypothetical protein
MKNILSRVFRFIPYILLGSFAIIFFGGLLIYGPEFSRVLKGWLMGYSIVAFVIGLVLLISQFTNGLLGLGLLIFFVILGISIVYSNKYDWAGCGLPVSVFFLIGWFIWFSMGADRVRNSRLLKNGVSAPGMIVSYKRTGVNVKVNTDYPRYGVELVIEVRPNDGPQFRSKAEAMLAEHEIANITEGMPVTVRYNPKDKDMVSIESW